VGGPARHKVREREERESIRPKVAARYAWYPHPKTRQIRSPDSLSRDRLLEILDAEAGGDWGALAGILEAAIDGYVCRHGLAVQELSGWDPWEHFDLASVASAAKLATNLEAAAAALELGNVAPFKRRDHTRRRRQEDTEAVRGKERAARAESDRLDAERQAERDRIAGLSLEELQAEEIARIMSTPPSAFRDQRLHRTQARHSAQVAIGL
jgi:hypothetical protein